MVDKRGHAVRRREGSPTSMYHQQGNGAPAEVHTPHDADEVRFGFLETKPGGKPMKDYKDPYE